ncbi:MAG: hypothetical protein IT228_11640 [Flavobacteriales bacterium]|nr:hypothetical protein [Flavobacteriales bacterium]MCC6577985.1 hypothetical protein [Flavobacteriales bacterium]NUQ14379.1 hypothetical protein [Flavobacteriales bacterium]
MHPYLEALKHRINRHGLTWPWSRSTAGAGAAVPPFSVIRKALDDLDRDGWYPRPLSGPVHVRGQVEGVNDHRCAVSIVLNERLAQVVDTDEEGRFALQLPADAAIRLVLVQPGHLPRLIEIRPWEGRPTNDHSKPMPIALHVMLTPREGMATKPMAERITLLDRQGRLLVEWDRVRGTQENGPHPEPMLRRAV